MHLHKRVNHKSEPLHVHLADVPHVDFQPHFKNSMHSLLASDWVIQLGSHFTTDSPLSFHPRSLGDGRFCFASRHLLQTPLWYRNHLVCKNNAFWVGGMVLIFWLREKYISILASLTDFRTDVWEYIKTTNLSIFSNFM